MAALAVKSLDGTKLTKTTIEDLPNEILSHICDYLEPRSLSHRKPHGFREVCDYSALRSLCMVKRRFREVAQHHLFATVSITASNVLNLFKIITSLRKDFASKIKAAHVVTPHSVSLKLRNTNPVDLRMIEQALSRCEISTMRWALSCNHEDGYFLALVELLLFFMPNLRYLETPDLYSFTLSSSTSPGEKKSLPSKLRALSAYSPQGNGTSLSVTCTDSLLAASNVRKLHVECDSTLHPLGIRTHNSSVQELNIFTPSFNSFDAPLLQHFSGLRSLSLLGSSFRWPQYLSTDRLSSVCRAMKSCPAIAERLQRLQISTGWPADRHNTQTWEEDKTIIDLSFLRDLNSLTIDRFDLVASNGIHHHAFEYCFAQTHLQWEQKHLAEFERPCEPFLQRLPDSLQNLCILRGDRSLRRELRRLPSVVSNGHLTRLKTLQMAPWKGLDGMTTSFSGLPAKLRSIGVKVEAVDTAWDGTLKQFRERTTEFGCNL